MENKESISHLKEAIAQGRHWYLALLEAMGLWTEAQEDYQGRHFQYLVGGEAFDWLLLAERLYYEIDGQVPEEEANHLLFYGKPPPLELPGEEFKRLIGASKYQAYLNYFYGITVEEALLLAVEEEVRKERRSTASPEEPGLMDEVFDRIYGASQATLFKTFFAEKGWPQPSELSFAELKEFTYWLFKYRLKVGEKDKVASDTQKGLAYLHRMRQAKKIFPSCKLRIED